VKAGKVLYCNKSLLNLKINKNEKNKFYRNPYSTYDTNCQCTK
jgi:hypothetical protein